MIPLLSKWYGTLCITTHNMVVSAYEFAVVSMSTQVTDLVTKSRYHDIGEIKVMGII